jgi:hypothetical protein
LYRLDAGQIVDGLQVVYAFIVVIDVEQAMVGIQLVINLLGLLLKRCIRAAAGENGGDRVKQVQICDLMRRGRLRAAAFP